MFPPLFLSTLPLLEDVVDGHVNSQRNYFSGKLDMSDVIDKRIRPPVQMNSRSNYNRAENHQGSGRSFRRSKYVTEYTYNRLFL